MRLAAIGVHHDPALHDRPQARRLRRPTPRLRGLTSATQRQLDNDAVVGGTADLWGTTYRARLTLSGKSSPDFLSYYNDQRPHSSLKGRTPNEAYDAMAVDEQLRLAA